MNKRLQGYTIVGFYDDNQQVWVEHVVAREPEEAAVKAIKKLEKINQTDLQITIVEIFCGTHKGQSKEPNLTPASHWMKI